MPRTFDRPGHLVSTFWSLWRASAPLTAAAVVLLGLLAVSLAGLLLDPRVITGAPAWLKPAKFAVSTAVYSLTLAWFFTFLPDWPRLRRFAGTATAAVFLLEVVLIDLQAWRGTTSHFNIGTRLDAVVFGIMGTAIAFQTLVGVAVAVALWRQPFADRAMGWAMRLGLTLSLVGATVGGIMTRPTNAQLDAARATGTIAVAGAHTVGAPDGGPGLPGTGWSREHGDLRVPHFIGLHAMQALPLLAIVLRRRRFTDLTTTRLVISSGISYGLLFVLLLWQALRGQSLLAPDNAMVVALGVWFAVTVSTAWVAATRHRRTLRPDALVY
jgi:hypothetical protein